MKPLLASTLTEKDLKSLINFPYYGSPKLDGIRCIIHPTNGPVTRNLKPIPNYHIRNTLSLLQIPYYDGEIIVGPPADKDAFNKTTGAVRSYTGKPNFKFYVFDHFKDLRHPYFVRLSNLKKQSEFIKVVNQVKLNNLKEVLAYEEECLEEGYEGIMLRSLSGIYKNGRSTLREEYLMKLKRFEDMEATIVSVNELFKNDNPSIPNELGYLAKTSHQENMTPANMLGSITVKAEGFEDHFEIGTGFTEEIRKSLWDLKTDIIGMKVKFKYQPHGTIDKPRFPVFLGIRDDL